VAHQEVPLLLDREQRAAIVLRYYEDLTEAQTADAMGCAVGTVKSQVSAGLRKLRTSLGDEALPLPHDPLSHDPLAVTR
jgi:DNA-directed RNA polymerase specialized sigma24 family protein